MKQIILQTTRQQYADLVKFLDRRCTIKTGEIADFQSVRAMVQAARLVDIPATDGKRIVRTVPIGRKSSESTQDASTTDNP